MHCLHLFNTVNISENYKVLKFLQLTPEEEERRRIKREKNKLAAQKCRSKKRKLGDTLEEVCIFLKY